MGTIPENDRPSMHESWQERVDRAEDFVDDLFDDDDLESRPSLRPGSADSRGSTLLSVRVGNIHSYADEDILADQPIRRVPSHKQQVQQVQQAQSKRSLHGVSTMETSVGDFSQELDVSAELTGGPSTMTGTDSEAHMKSVMTAGMLSSGSIPLAAQDSKHIFTHGGYEDSLDQAMAVAEGHLKDPTFSAEASLDTLDQQPRRGSTQPVRKSIMASEMIETTAAADPSGRRRTTLSTRKSLLASNNRRMTHKVVGAAAERFLLDDVNAANANALLQKKRVLCVAPAPKHECVMFDEDGWNERKEELLSGMENRQHLHPRTKGIMEEIQAMGGYRVKGQAPIPPKSALSGRPPRQRRTLPSSEMQDMLAGVVLKDTAEKGRLAGNEQNFSSLKLEFGKSTSTASLKPRGSIRSYFPAASKAALANAKPPAAHHPPRLSGALTAR